MKNLSRSTLLLVASLALAVSLAPAQVIVYSDDSNPATGGANTIPFQQAAGYTTFHIYTADQLQAAGVAPGAVLTDFAVAPVTVGPGNYSAPTARMLVGHLLDTQIPTGWESNLATPTIVHDVTSGAYTFPWAGSTWTSLPGFAAAGFAWDGLRDIGLYYTSASATGTFQVRTDVNNPRFGVTVYNATTQTPTTTGFFALKARLTFSGTLPQANTPQATLTLNGSAGPTHLAGNETLTIALSSTTAANYPFFLLIATAFTGGHIPLNGQSFDLGSAGGGFSDVIIVTPGGFNPFLTGPLIPFAALDGVGNFSLPLPLGCGAPSIGKTFIQAGILDPGHPDGFRTTGLPSVDVKAGCRHTSAATFPIAIPDAGAPVTAAIGVPIGTMIADLDVVVSFAHPQYGDISMTLDLNGLPFLTALIPGPADASDLTGVYHLSDEALITLDVAASTSGTTIIPGRYRPDNPLAAFDGIDAGGVWTLTVQDMTATQIGSLLGFQIILNGIE